MTTKDRAGVCTNGELLNHAIARATTGQGKKASFGKASCRGGSRWLRPALQKGEYDAPWRHYLARVCKARMDQASRLRCGCEFANAAMGAPSSIDLSSPARTATVGLADLIPGGSFIQPFISALFASRRRRHCLGRVIRILVGEVGPELFTPRYCREDYSQQMPWEGAATIVFISTIPGVQQRPSGD